MLLVEHELPTRPEHLISSPVFRWLRVTRSLVWCVCFVDHCLSCGPFFVCPSSIYNFWSSLRYLQTFFKPFQWINYVESFLLYAHVYHIKPIMYRLSEVRITRSFVLCTMLCRSIFVLFLLTIVLSIFLDLRIMITSLVSSINSSS